MTRGEVEVDAGQTSGRFVRRIWLEPEVAIHPPWPTPSAASTRSIIGPGSFYTSLMPIFLVARGGRGAGRTMQRPGDPDRQPADRGPRHGAASRPPTPSPASKRPFAGRSTSVIANTQVPSAQMTSPATRSEHKAPLELGELPDLLRAGGRGLSGVSEIARHDRRRLAYACGACCRSGCWTEARTRSPATGGPTRRFFAAVFRAVSSAGRSRGRRPLRRRLPSRGLLRGLAAPPAFFRAARSSTSFRSLPASPPFAGRFDVPDRRVIGGEDVLEVAVALDAPRRERRDVERRPTTSSRCLMSSQPAPPPRGNAARPHQHPRSLQLVAVQRELEVALLQRGVHSSTSGSTCPGPTA